MEYFALVVIIVLFAAFCYGLYLCATSDEIDPETLQILLEKLKKKK